MIMDKIRKNRLFFIIIFILMILFIGFLFIIDFNKKNTETPDIDNTYPLENDSDIIELEASDLLLKSKIDLNSNFSNQILTYNKITYNFSCIDYNENYTAFDNEYACKRVKMSIMNYVITFPIEEIDSCSEKHYFIWKNGYMIYQYVADCGGCGYIYISKDDKVIYFINNVSTIPFSNDTMLHSLMKLKNNNLYYFITEENDFVLKKIDLSIDNIQEQDINRYKNTKKLYCLS